MIGKPEVSELDKKRTQELYTYMKLVGRPCTKEELCRVIGWEYNKTNDRRIRELINRIKKRRPIIATPDQRGYKVATDREDLEEVVHQWRYIDKVQADLEETKGPLMKFVEKMR